MKKVYKIEVDCANCAAKMEIAARKIPGVTAISVNYMTQKMTVEFSDDADIATALETVRKTCKKIDPDFTVEL